METKDYNLTCGEVIDNLLTLADAYEKASAGKAPNGFACNPTDAAANMKAAVHFIGSFGQQLPQWISARERVPDHGGTVVCRTAGRELRFARVMRVTTYADGTPATECHWMGYPDGQLEVTHWFELPEPPEEA